MRFYDRVHGNLTFPPFVERFVRTPAFQRLDKIRQLGGCSFVYPSATHTRLEHSLGVCYLAGVLGRHLQRLVPSLVDDEDVVCVQLAGLLHDLGHGPFSHLFEEYVRQTCDPTWSHEDMTIRMIDALWVQVDLTGVFRTDSDTHLAFVKLLVLGHDPAQAWPGEEVGRSSEKRFLAEVVHNRYTGIDVDKLDYLARDAMAVLGATHAFDVQRVLDAVRVVRHADRPRLAFDERVAFSLSETYALRARLHRQVYQHRSVLLVEGALKDLLAARWHEIRSCLHDPHRFLDVVDATVLTRPGREDDAALAAWDALYRAPSHMRRIPLTACILTRPVCDKCRAETDVRDAFCRRCGQPLESRRGEDVDGLLVPPTCQITSVTATRDLVEVTQVPTVRVHVIDVHCGPAVAVVDPFGRVWRDHDPFDAVLFCNGSDLTPFHMSCAPFFTPEVRHVMTAHCYLPHDMPEEEVGQTTAHFRQWAYRHGMPVEEDL